MVTSDVTGWHPNRARLFISKDVLIGWKYSGDFVKSSNSNVMNTFSSQGSSVFYYKNNFYFMADKWNTSNLKNSGYLVKKIYWDGPVPYID